MQKRDAHDSDSVASGGDSPATPRASEELPTGPLAADTPLPESNTRAAVLPGEPSASSEPSDTLLSAGRPAARLEVMLEDRLAVVDERLRELDARLAVLERKKPIAAAEPRQKPLLWIAFLIALVVVFQLLHRMR
jgi:hypothetical protein